MYFCSLNIHVWIEWSLENLGLWVVWNWLVLMKLFILHISQKKSCFDFPALDSIMFYKHMKETCWCQTQRHFHSEQTTSQAWRSGAGIAIHPIWLIAISYLATEVVWVINIELYKAYFTMNVLWYCFVFGEEPQNHSDLTESRKLISMHDCGSLQLGVSY